MSINENNEYYCGDECNEYDTNEYDCDDECSEYDTNEHVPTILFKKQPKSREIISFTKETFREIYFLLNKKGLWYTISYIKNTIRKYQNGDYVLYLHTIADFRRCMDFLNKMENENIDLFEKKYVGSGSVCNGESWGDFYDLVVKDKIKINNFFREEQKKFSFGYDFNYNY